MQNKKVPEHLAASRIMKKEENNEIEQETHFIHAVCRFDRRAGTLRLCEPIDNDINGIIFKQQLEHEQ
jgi:hypothetical protein